MTSIFRRPHFNPLFLLAAFVLPAVLLFSAVRTFQGLAALRTDYLRNIAATVAAGLETLPPDAPPYETLAAEQGALFDLRVYDEDSSNPDPALAPIWQGRELYRIAEATVDGVRVFRAYIPFHREGRMRVARIDIDESAADFIVVHARHNVAVAALSGAVLMLLSFYAIWSVRRQMRLQHLAHLGEMSAVLAHEIRNPLGTMKGFVQLAQERADAPTRALLDPVLDETQRLERLVSDLLLYGRPPQPAFRIVRWSEIRDAVALRNGRIRYAAGTSELTLSTDPNLLKQILLNLLRNAAEAAREEVSLSARVEGASIVIAVEDDGPGIPEEVRKRLFESFFTTKSFGTGLGLAIAKKLTVALGGTIELLPRTGGGTLAEIRLKRGDTRHGTDSGGG